MGVVNPVLAPRFNWTEPAEPEHVVQFYETDAHLVQTLRDYFSSGLAAGDAAVLVATAPHTETLEEALRADGVDIDAARSAGRYVSLDAAEALPRIMKDCLPDDARFAEVIGNEVARAVRGGRRVRVFGELVAMLCAEGNRGAAIRLEELWNELGSIYPFTLLCAYPLRCFEGSALASPFAEVCATHSRVIPGETYSALPSADERLREIARLQQQAHSLQSEAAKRREASLNRSIRLRDEFLASISHDLKTPLTVLHGQAQVLRRRATLGKLDQQGILKALEQIETRSRMITGLVSELLDVTQLRAGEELHLERGPVDLVDVVRDALAQQEDGLGQRVTVLTGDEDLTGWWDRGRLAHVLKHLLANAIKYRQGEGEIAVRLSRETNGLDDYAVVTIEDRGIGIPETDLPHIFERFYRGKNATGAVAGSGLGLAGARQIVEQHGGSITVESVEGSGTTVTVRLPLGLNG